MCHFAKPAQSFMGISVSGENTPPVIPNLSTGPTLISYNLTNLSSNVKIKRVLLQNIFGTIRFAACLKRKQAHHTEQFRCYPHNLSLSNINHPSET